MFKITQNLVEVVAVAEVALIVIAGYVMLRIAAIYKVI